MPTTGSYEFRLAMVACGHSVDEAHLGMMERGEWAWLDLAREGRAWHLVFRCPDCGEIGELWQIDKGHSIDAYGNVSPSVSHSWKYGDPPVERCGFHTQPTKLLDFVDMRVGK